MQQPDLRDVQLDWPYHRIFLRYPETDGDWLAEYVTLLREVVRPLWEEFGSTSPHMHFLHYGRTYGENREGEPYAVSRPAITEDAQHVFFVRLRFAVVSEQRGHYDEMIATLVEACSVILGVEQVTPDYDIFRDLGGRFGDEHVPEVAALMHNASLLALKYSGASAESYDPHPEWQGGSFGAVHLVANTLMYSIHGDGEKDVVDWHRVRRFSEDAVLP